MAKKTLLLDLDQVSEGKIINSLVASAHSVGADNATIRLFNINQTKDLTASISIDRGQKPADMVLNELTDWAEKNNPDVFARINALTADMSWNENNPV